MGPRGEGQELCQIRGVRLGNILTHCDGEHWGLTPDQVFGLVLQEAF